MRSYRPWKIKHVDLSQAILPVPEDDSSDGVYLVFWWKDIPLGKWEIPGALLPVSASQVAEKALDAITPAVGARIPETGFYAPLPERRSNIPPGSQFRLQTMSILGLPVGDLLKSISKDSEAGRSHLSVSVVICTRDRGNELERCLHSLRGMSVAASEIVVVDNNPGSGEVREVLSRFNEVRYVPEERPGLSVARNTGISHCSSDIVAFADDDVEVHRNWVDALLKAFQEPDVMAVTGLILPAEMETEAQYKFQHGLNTYGWGYCPLKFDAEFFSRTVPWGAPVWHIGAGANMSFRRELFSLVGGFDARLGAGASGCSEDSEMWYRILAGGWSCRYQPDAVVHHYDRRADRAAREQRYQYMRGHVAALLIQFQRHHHWGNLYRLFVTLPYYYTRLLLRRTFRGEKPGLEMLGTQIRGCLAGILFFLRHPRAGTSFPGRARVITEAA